MAQITISGLLFSLLFLMTPSTPAVAASGPSSSVWMKIDPTEIGVDLFYGGARVHVEGAIPAGYDAAIVCRGQETEVDLKRKGKVMGFLWMNVADVLLERVPALYLLSTSSALTELAPSPVLQELQVGYPALEARALRSPGQSGNDADFREFVKLKESEKLYSYDEGGVTLEPGANGATRVSAECLLPSKAPWGEYEVRLLGFKDRRGELLRTERLRLAPVGVTARISTLASGHGLLYGVAAVVIALAVGLLTGLVFGLAAKKGH